LIFQIAFELTHVSCLLQKCQQQETKQVQDGTDFCL
jgi:hypothetical protein